MTQSPSSDLPEDQLPQEVVAALRQRHRSKIKVPESRDSAVLSDVSRHLYSVSRSQRIKTGGRRRAWVAMSTGTLAAAVLLFVVYPRDQDQMSPAGDVAVQEKAQPAPAAASAVAVLTHDVDGNGHVDILDALALARIVKAKRPTGSHWDQNGDGRIDQFDVDVIARTAVML